MASIGTHKPSTGTRLTSIGTHTYFSQFILFDISGHPSRVVSRFKDRSREMVDIWSSVESGKEKNIYSLKIRAGRPECGVRVSDPPNWVSGATPTMRMLYGLLCDSHRDSHTDNSVGDPLTWGHWITDIRSCILWRSQTLSVTGCTIKAIVGYVRNGVAQ